MRIRHFFFDGTVAVQEKPFNRVKGEVVSDNKILLSINEGGQWWACLIPTGGAIWLEAL